MRGKRIVRKHGGGCTVMLTGTFFSENWIMNHLRPLAASQACSRIWIVTTFPIPVTQGITPLYPPRWCIALFGSTPARLTVCALAALKHRPDFVGGFHLLINGLVGLLLAKATGAQSIYFCGGGPREVLGGGYLGNRVFGFMKQGDAKLERKLVSAVGLFDLVITMGPKTVDFFRAQGLRNRFEVIPGGIDGTRAKSNNHNRIYDVIFVGRLVQVKRVDILLETVNELRKWLPNVSAAIIGTGESEPALREYASKLGIDKHVVFAGYQQDVIPWLQQSRVFVLTSESEGLSLALMEAMMCGLPCVVSDVGELRELVDDGSNGYVVTELSAKAFAHKLVPILSNEITWLKYSEAARQSARRFDICEVSHRWDEILRTAC